MNIPSTVQKTKIRSPRRLFNFRFAAVLACICLSLGLMLPVIKNLAGNHHPMPQGQLKADMRTMIAAMRYLLNSEPAVQQNPGPYASIPSTFAQSTSNRPLEMSDSLSNQVQIHAGSWTNPPAQT